MKKTVNTTNVGFSKAYNLLPAGEQSAVRAKIMESCGWESLATFYHKKDGKVSLHKLEGPVLERIFEEYNINAWTGEYIRSLA